MACPKATVGRNRHAPHVEIIPHIVELGLREFPALTIDKLDPVNASISFSQGMFIERSKSQESPVEAEGNLVDLNAEGDWFADGTAIVCIPEINLAFMVTTTSRRKNIRVGGECNSKQKVAAVLKWLTQQFGSIRVPAPRERIFATGNEDLVIGAERECSQRAHRHRLPDRSQRSGVKQDAFASASHKYDHSVWTYAEMCNFWRFLCATARRCNSLF
jgi:hypothetical protein